MKYGSVCARLAKVYVVADSLSVKLLILYRDTLLHTLIHNYCLFTEFNMPENKKLNIKCGLCKS